MKKKGILIRFILMVAVIVIFQSCDYRFWMLKSKKLTFNELPFEVKNYLENPTTTTDLMICISLQDTLIYRLETVKTIIGPWVAYKRLIDRKKNVSYRISQTAATPYIIFQNKLYIPDRWYILYEGNAFEAKYTEYELK